MYGVRPYGTLPYGVVPDPADAPTLVQVPFSITATARFSIYASTAIFNDNDDATKRQAFDGGMVEPLRFDASAQSDIAVVSGFSSGDGSMSLDNTEGQFNILTGAYALDGRDHEVRIGSVDVPFANWFPVFRGTARSFHIDSRTFSLQLADYGHKLDQPLQPNTYAGTGGVEGGDDLIGKRKPKLFGYCDNVSPVLLSASNLLYQVHDGAVQDISAVYANGVALVDEGDVADATTLIAASITSGRFKTCLALGLFRINFSLDNTIITADVEGDDTGNVFAATVPDIVRRMASLRLDDTEVYEPGFAAYKAGAAYEAGYYADQNSSVTVRDAIADMLGAGSFAFFTRLGKLSIARLVRPTNSPIARLDDTTVISAERLPLSQGLSIPPYQWRVAYGRNWTQMGGNIAGAVSDARRAFLSEPIRYAVAEAQSIKTTHPLSQTREIAGYLRSEAAAQSEADRLLALHRRPGALYRLRLGLKGYRIEQGHTVHVTSSRLRWLANGKHLFVIERSIDATNRQIEIVGYG